MRGLVILIAILMAMVFMAIAGGCAGVIMVTPTAMFTDDDGKDIGRGFKVETSYGTKGSAKQNADGDWEMTIDKTFKSPFEGLVKFGPGFGK